MEAWQKTPTSQGIIAQMAELYSVDAGVYPPFLNGGEIAMYVDNYYYYAWSGDKFVSPMVRKLKEANGLTWQANVAKSVWAVIQQQLFKEWAAFTARYDPVANYHVTETVDYEHSGSNSYTDSGSDTRKQKGKIIQGGSVTTENKASTYESDGKQTGMSISRYGKDGAANDQFYTQYGDGNTPLENELVYGKTREGSESGSDDLTTEKYGNLGILPAAQLLQMDIELWKINFYTTIMFPLIDKAIALPIY